MGFITKYRNNFTAILIAISTAIFSVLADTFPAIVPKMGSAK